MNPRVLLTIGLWSLCSIASAHDVRDFVAPTVDGTTVLAPAWGDIILDSGTLAFEFRGFTWVGWSGLGRPSMPYVQATQASYASSYNPATFTKVVFGSESADTHNAFDISTSVFTAPATGVYLIAAHLLGPSNGTPGSFRVSALVAGTRYITLSEHYKDQTITASQALEPSGSESIMLSTGETVEIVGSSSAHISAGVMSVTKLSD